MILALLILLFVLKFNYPEWHVDYCIGVVCVLLVLSLAIVLVVYRLLDVQLRVAEYRREEGEALTCQVEVRYPETHTVLRPVMTLKHLQSGETQKRKWRMQTEKSDCTFENLQAGSYELCLESVQVFGLFRVLHLPKRVQLRKQISVYPHPAPVNYQYVRMGYEQGGSEILNAPGDDYSEIYEVRPLQEGDDLRYVHRSLSAKYDEYIIKVGSDSRRPYYIYMLNREPHFSQMVNRLAQVAELKRKAAESEGGSIGIVYDGKLQRLDYDSQVYQLMDQVFAEYVHG